MQKLPGVQSAGAVSGLPLERREVPAPLRSISQTVPLEDTTPEADQRVATRDYFKAMGISLVRGRFFDARDAATAPHVAIMDESLANLFFPNQDPIGKRLHQGGRGGKTNPNGHHRGRGAARAQPDPGGSFARRGLLGRRARFRPAP